MERPSRPAATAREIILEIVRNMREGLEPLQYSTLPPSIYQVYLYPDDLERLRGIAPRIVEEARRALDAELESLNRASLGERLKIARRDLPKVSAPEGGWQIGIHENTDDGVEPGDIVVNSELALPAKTEFGAGSMTKRISTRRLESTARTSLQPTVAVAAAEAGAFATVEYEDNGGRKTFSITKNEIVVGRGGRDYWTDIKLDTLADVSREHFRLRRDAESGKFFLKDLSRLGTTINGEAAPSSIDFSDGEKHDLHVEAPVPAQARIGLAGVVFLEFRSLAGG
jgi:hypothetical protein